MSSFDSLAKIYEPLERASFSGKLQGIRCFCLPFAKDCGRGLLVGDGDGRFSSALLRSNRRIEIDSIDISSRMLEEAKRRAGGESSRLHQRAEDGLAFAYPEARYDFIGLHFCLDCFSQAEVDTLLPKLNQALRPGGLLAYSDFQANLWWQRAAVRALYLSFRLGAGLTTQRLPNVSWGAAFEEIAQTQVLGGLVFSQVLRKRQAGP